MRHELNTMLRLNHEQIARLAHETLRSACIMFVDAPPAPWADANDHQRRAIVSVVTKLVEQPTLTARQSHEAWVKEQQDAGWAFGPIRCTVSKRNPLLVAWSELSPKYRAKQALVFAVVRHLLYPEREAA